MPGTLDGVRVVDFTHALNGPFCTMLLGHLGAEIVKIEPPSGDNFRRSWPTAIKPQSSARISAELPIIKTLLRLFAWRGHGS